MRVAIFLSFLNVSFLLSSPALGAPVPCRTPASPEAAANKSPAEKVARSAEKFANVETAVASISAQERSSLLFLINRGTEEELVAIPGIAETKARIIVQSRPLSELGELILLRGFGFKTLCRILDYGEQATQ